MNHHYQMENESKLQNTAHETRLLEYIQRKNAKVKAKKIRFLGDKNLFKKVLEKQKEVRKNLKILRQENLQKERKTTGKKHKERLILGKDKQQLKNCFSLPQLDIHKVTKQNDQIVDQKNLETKANELVINQERIDTDQKGQIEEKQNKEYKTGSYQIQQQDQKEHGLMICPLDQEDFPIVLEVHHQTGRCFCDLCTCRKHICPSIAGRRNQNQFTYRTSYQNEYFAKYQSYPLLKTERNKDFRFYLPTDYRTVKQLVYGDTAKRIRENWETKKNTLKYRRTAQSEKFLDLKFLGTTSNQYHYPD